MSEGSEKLLLASFIVRGIDKVTKAPDMKRVRLVVSGGDEEMMRQRIQSFANGAKVAFVLEPVEKLNYLADLSEGIKRACQSNEFVLAAIADQPEASQ